MIFNSKNNTSFLRYFIVLMVIQFILGVVFVLNVYAVKIVEEIDDQDSNRPVKLRAQINDGFLYRSLDEGQTIQGIYTKSSKYYDLELLEDSINTKNFVFTKGIAAHSNYFAAVFYGIWSFQEDGKHKETIKLVEVPVRQVVSDKMKSTPKYPRLVWKVGEESEYRG